MPEPEPEEEDADMDELEFEEPSTKDEAQNKKEVNH